MKNQLITITGGDLCGKQTQAGILMHVLEREGIKASTMEFPRYDRPFGKMMGAMLDGEKFIINGYWAEDVVDNTLWHAPGFSRSMRGGASWTGALEKSTNGDLLFQTMCIADKLDAQEDIGKALEDGWLVCDRYDPELLVYGIADAPNNREWVERSWELLKHTSDIVVVLINRSGQYSRDGEPKDANERDMSFQNRIYDLYEELAPKYGWHIIHVDKLQKVGNFPESVWNVSSAIIAAINSHGFQFKWSDPDILMCAEGCTL